VTGKITSSCFIMNTNDCRASRYFVKLIIGFNLFLTQAHLIFLPDITSVPTQRAVNLFVSKWYVPLPIKPHDPWRTNDAPHTYDANVG
jgi:hypothetical protein